MIGLSGLIDTLLAANSSPRLDVRAIKGEAEIGAPGAVLRVGKAGNDVRLPSHAAMDRLIAAGTPGAPPPAGPRSAQFELSAAARVISAVLAGVHGDAGPVRGAAPAWPSAQAASATVLAATLAQTVSDSGLFYESHLTEFATGSRTLAQMAREPQARWAAPAAAGVATTVPSVAAELPKLAPASASAAISAMAKGVLANSDLPDPPARANAAEGARGPHADAKAPAAPQVAGGGAHAADLDPHSDAARIQAAYRWGEAATAATAAAPDAAPSAKSVETAAARHVSAAAAPAVATELMHPQAVTLVHQQLDLLATAVFRWSGQVWPGVPMEWTVQQEVDEQEGREAREAAEEAPRPWSTTVSLNLPQLGAVDLRLSLVGPSVQARWSAREAATVVRLRAEGDALAQRLQAAGLRLQEFHVDAMAPS